MENVVNIVNWQTLDILIGTPNQFEDILKLKQRIDRFNVNPKYIVVDEFDQIVNEKQLFKSFQYILRLLSSKNRRSQYEGESESRTIVLTAASYLKYFEREEFEEVIKDWFPGISTVKGDNLMKISEKIEHKSYDVSELDELEKTSLVLQMVQEYIQAQKTANKKSKILMFFNNSLAAQEVSKVLTQNMIPSANLHSNLSVNDRIQNLSKFHQIDSGLDVLCCTDIAARGLDFKNLDLVIQYDYAKNAATLLHRFGRTGRMDSEGTVISFLEDEDKLLHIEFEKRREKGEKMDDIFSRNRSFSKSRPGQ
jgi:superfamily II DNA/RNA helicase